MPSRAVLRDDCPRVILGNPLSPTEHVRGAQPSQQDRAKGVRGLRNAEPGLQVGRGAAETRSRLRTRDGGGGRSGRGRGRVSSPVSARPAWRRGVSGGAATRAEPTRPTDRQTELFLSPGSIPFLLLKEKLPPAGIRRGRSIRKSELHGGASRREARAGRRVYRACRGLTAERKCPRLDGLGPLSLSWEHLRCGSQP